MLSPGYAGLGSLPIALLSLPQEGQDASLRKCEGSS
jgi:hypothetical protein